MPQVTVTDPARPPHAADVLEAAPRPVSRRRLLAGVGLVVALALVAVGLQVRAERAAAEEERRLRAVVELAVQPEGSSSVYDPGTRTARLESRLLLVNDGPRDHVVQDGTAGGFTLVRAGLRVRAGDSVPLVLGASVRCSSTRPAEVPTGPLALQLQGGRGVELPVDLSVAPDAAARACGFVPLAEVGFVSVLGASRPPGALELALELGTQAIRPVDVLGLEVGPGLRSELRRSDGTPVAFPLALALGDGPGYRAEAFALRIEAADCDAARAGAGSPSLALELRAEDGETARVETLYELGYLLDLLLDVC